MPSQTNEYSTNGITYLLNGNGVNGANEAIVKKVDPSAIQNNTLTIPAEITKEDKEYHVTTLDSNAICNEINGPDEDNLKNLEEISFEGPIALEDHAISNCYNLKILRFYAEVKSVKAYAIGFLCDRPLQNKIQIFGGRSTKRTFVDIDQNNKEIIKGNVICYNGTPPNQIEIDFQDMIKENENFCYVEDGDEIIIKSIKNNNKIVIIPEEIEGKKVTVDSYIANSNLNSLLEEIVFPKTIDKIPRYTLYMCTNLKKITITNPNCDIDNEFIKLDNNTRHIDLIAPSGSKAQTFANNQSNFEFKELTPSINDQTKETDDFKYTETADDVTITQIKRLDNDSKIIIPKEIEGKAVTKIDSTAFDDVRDKVKIVEIKSNIKTIEKELFKNCKKLTQVTLPETIEKINDGAFSGTENLTSLTIPNTTNTIANNAFEGCKINLISDSQDVKNYVDTLGTSNVTFQKLQTLLNEWQYFENITPMYQLDVTTDLESINNKLKEYRDQIQDNEQKQKIEELCNEIKSVDPSTNDIKYIAFSIPKDEKIYKIAVAAANYNKIKNLTNQLKGSDIVCEPSIKAYRQDKNQGPEQYERYLYDFNKTINGEAQAKKDLDNKSPLEHTRNPYSFESNKDKYYNPIYVNRYRKSKENPIQGKKLFGKKLANIGKLNDPEHQGLSQNLKKFARILNHMAGDSQNKLNENDKDARSAHLSIKLLLSKPFKIVVLTAALIFAGTTLLPILANFAFSVGMIPGIIASGGLANPAVQHSLSAALYTGIATIGTGFMAYMVRHLKKKKEQKLAQHEQSSNAAGVNSESQQEQRTDTAGTSSEGQQEQRTDTTGTSSEGQQEETQEVGQKMAEADVLGMINQEFYKLKKSKDAYEEAQDLLENGNNEKNEKINELEETYEIQKEYFVNLLLDYYINYPVKFEGGSLTI